MLVQGFITVILLSVFIMSMCMILTRTNTDKIGGLIETVRLPDGSTKIHKFKNSMEWIRNSWIGENWFLFNGIAVLSSLITGSISVVSPLSKGLYGDDKPMWILMLIVSTMFGFHLVWSTCIDWRFRKIPRLPIVFSMLIVYAAAITCTILSPYFKFYIYFVIFIPIMLFMIGFVPGSGMSDGRLYTMISAGAIPFMSTQIVWPTLLVGVITVINAIVITVAGRVNADDTNVPLVKRIMKSRSPMGPFVMIVFTLWFLLTLFGIVPSNSIMVVI